MGLFGLFKKTKRLVRAFELSVDTSSYSNVSSEEKFKRSLELYKNGADFELCLSLLIESANEGFADAQYQLASFLIKGEEVKQDYPNAALYLKKAIAQNHPVAMYDLAFLYQNGYGCVRDYNKAFELYKKSADLGFVDAIHQVGAYYWEGLGVDKDEIKAIEWFKKACDKDFVPSLVILGNIYYNQEKDAESYNLLLRAKQLGSEEASELLEDEVYNQFR